MAEQTEGSQQLSQQEDVEFAKSIEDVKKKLNEKELKKKNWTIMVYLAGDNNLAEEMVYSLKCMWSVGSSEECKIYALYDFGLQPVTFEIPSPPKPSVHSLDITNERVQNRMFFDGPVTENYELLRKAEEIIRKLKDKSRNEERIDSVQVTLEKFIKESIVNAPANHYMLVLSGHGTGNVGDFLSASKRPYGLSIPDLSETLWNIEDCFARNEALDIYSKMDILGLDSCQMGTAEVAGQVADHVDFLVGSEGWQPNAGWPYDLMLAQLNRRIVEEYALRKYIEDSGYERFESNPDLTTSSDRAKRRDGIQAARIAVAKRVYLYEALKDDSEVGKTLPKAFRHLDIVPLLERAQTARDESIDPSSNVKDVFPTPMNLAAGIVREHIKFYSSDYSLAEVSTDLSALNLKKFRNVRHCLRKLAKSLANSLENKISADSLKDAITLAHWDSQGYRDEQNADLWDFCYRLQERLGKSDKNDPITKQCEDLRNALDKNTPRDQLVLRSGYCGPAFQHSHGLSIYFPWACFTDAAGVKDLDHYQALELAATTNWDKFLKKYLDITQRPSRETRDQNEPHESTLNRCSYLYTGSPGNVDKEKEDEDKKIRLELDNRIKLQENEGILGGNLIVKIFGINEGDLSEESRLTEISELSIEGGKLKLGEKDVEGNNEYIVEDGKFNGFEVSIEIPNKMMEVKDGRVTVRDSVLFIEDDQVMVRDGRVTVRDGRVTVRDGRVTVRDGRVTVRDGRVTIRDGRVTVRDGRVTVRDGRVTVRDGRVTVRGGDVGVRDGRVTVRDGRVTVRDGRVTVRDGRVTVRGGFIARDGRVTVRDAGGSTGRSAGNNGSDVRGAGLGLLTKIASMKNPPVCWRDCDLIADERKSAEGQQQQSER